MKLSELIRKYPFDTIVPELIAQDAKAESQLAWYKQAYNTLLETAPAGDSWEIEVTREFDELDGGGRHYYVHAHDCEGMPWDGCLASEVVIRDDIPELSAVARILWGMTFYGYTEEEKRHRCDDKPRNIYEQKAERLRDRQFRNYAYGLGGKFEMENRALTWEDWEVYCRRKAHRNRAKRMRDARQNRSIERLDRAGKVQAAIDRFQSKDHEPLEYLFDTHQILELTFTSHVQTAGERATYISELLTKYYRGNLSDYTHCEILLTTSDQHPVSVVELRALHIAIASLFGITTDSEGHTLSYSTPQLPVIRYRSQTAESMAHNIELFLILSR